MTSKPRYLGLEKQAAYNTAYGANTPEDTSIDIISEDFTAENNLIEVNTAGYRGTIAAHPGGYYPTGKIEMYADAGWTWNFVVGALGACDDGGDDEPEADVIEFIAWGTDELPSYRLCVGMDGITEKQITGAVVNSLEVSMAAGEAIMYSADIQARTMVYAATASPTFKEPYTRFPFHDLAVTIDGSVYECKAFNYSINNNLPSGEVIGARVRQGGATVPLPQKRVIEGSFDLRFDNVTHLDDFLGSTDGSPADSLARTTGIHEILVDATSATLAGATFYFDIWAYFPKCVYSTGWPAVSQRDEIIQSINFKALWEENVPTNCANEPADDATPFYSDLAGAEPTAYDIAMGMVTEIATYPTTTFDES